MRHDAYVAALFYRNAIKYSHSSIVPSLCFAALLSCSSALSEVEIGPQPVVDHVGDAYSSLTLNSPMLEFDPLTLSNGHFKRHSILFQKLWEMPSGKTPQRQLTARCLTEVLPECTTLSKAMKIISNPPRRSRKASHRFIHVATRMNRHNYA